MAGDCGGATPRTPSPRAGTAAAAAAGAATAAAAARPTAYGGSSSRTPPPRQDDSTTATSTPAPHPHGASPSTPLFPNVASALFFSTHPPPITLGAYVSRFTRHLAISPAVYVVALIYLDRVAAADAALALTPLNVHRLLTVAVSLATKVVEDGVVRPAAIARVGGVPSAGEMAVLEGHLLTRLGWRLHVRGGCFEAWRRWVFGAGGGGGVGVGG